MRTVRRPRTAPRPARHQAGRSIIVSAGTPDSDDARSSFGESGPIAETLNTSARTSRLDVLTPRELEVLSLLTEGLTNRGIEERLVISAGTVHTHLRHIFAKLELPDEKTEHRRVHAALTFLRSASRPVAAARPTEAEPIAPTG